MYKKTAAIFLLACILCGTVSCSSGTTGETAAPETGPAAAAETEPVLTDEDYLGFASEDNGGATFTVLSNLVKDYEFNVESLTGDVVDDATFEKDQKVQEYLGIKLEIILEDGNWNTRDRFNAFVTQAVTAGDDTYDLVNNTIVCTMPIASTGCFVDGKSLPHVNFENPWWIANMYDRFSVSGKLFGFLGDASLSLYKDMSVIFFNKDIWEQQKPEVNLYDMVRENTWTLDNFITLCGDMAIDMNGDGVCKAEDGDQMTFIGEYVPNGTWQTALDLPVVELDENGTPVFLGLTEKFASAYERLQNVHKTTGAANCSSIDDQSFTSMKLFAEGNVATMCNFIYSTEYLRDMERDYGILPIPKYDESQSRYITQLGTSTSALFVPLTASNRDLTSKVMESLAYYGYTLVSPRYYEVALKTKYSSDTDMQEMLDIIRAGATFDFVFAYGTSLTSAPNTHFRFYNTSEVVASSFAAIKVPFEKSLAVMAEKYAELEN